MITEDYVSLETAKLLKEKGFNEDSWFHYDNDGDIVTRRYRLNRPDDVPAWTLQIVMKWLREVYGLFIRITEDITGNVFEWSVYQKNYGCKASTYVEDSYEKACEAAIKYCLENLI